MIKRIFKNIADKLGYDIRNTKYIPVHFTRDKNLLKITFDHVIYHHLMQMGDPAKFFFIQVGAFDGIECDPLYEHIKKYSWQGIMLEPQPKAFAKLQELYSKRENVKLINAAIGKTETKAKFFILEGEDLPTWSNGMASFDLKNIIKHKNIIPGIENYVRETEIDCITFKNIFSKFSITQVDLLQIDTEGFDAEIIYMFPFNLIKPSIIHFESKHLSKAPLEKLLNYLTEMNYYIAYDGSEDMLAVLTEETP